MNKFNVESALQKVQSKVNMVTAKVIDAELVSPGLYRVVASFPMEAKLMQRGQMRQAIAKCFRGHAVAVESSFREIAGYGPLTVAGYVSGQRQVVELSEENAGLYKEVAANVMMSAEDESIWDVSNKGGGTFLTRRGEEDLDDLIALASLKARQSGDSVVASSQLDGVARGQYVTYVNPKTQEVAHGVILSFLDIEVEDEDGEISVDEHIDVLEKDADGEQAAVVRITASHIIEVAELDDFINANEDLVELRGEYNEDDPDSMKQYYAKVFNYDPAYLGEFDDTIDHVAVM